MRNLSNLQPPTSNRYQVRALEAAQAARKAEESRAAEKAKAKEEVGGSKMAVGLVGGGQAGKPMEATTVDTQGENFA